MSKKSAIPQPLSEGEESLARDLKAYKIPFDREWKFHPERNFAIDFKLQCRQSGYALAGVEVEGGTLFGKSRHSRGEGFERDCEKYNEAARLGIKIFRFTTAQIKSANAIDYIRDFYNSLTGEDGVKI